MHVVYCQSKVKSSLDACFSWRLKALGGIKSVVYCLPWNCSALVYVIVTCMVANTMLNLLCTIFDEGWVHFVHPFIRYLDMCTIQYVDNLMRRFATELLKRSSGRLIRFSIYNLTAFSTPNLSSFSIHKHT